MICVLQPLVSWWGAAAGTGEAACAEPSPEAELAGIAFLQWKSQLMH